MVKLDIMNKRFKLLPLILIILTLFISGCMISFDRGDKFYPEVETDYSLEPALMPELPNKNENYSIGAVNSKLYEGELADMLEAVRPSVVDVYVYENAGDEEAVGAGSGVFIAKSNENGVEVYYILTCYHVIEDMPKYLVKDIYGNEFSASYIGGDVAYDIAVIKISPTADGYSLTDKHSLKFVQITIANVRFDNGEAYPLRIGDSVYAIGNPLGTLGGTVTQGIISSTDREVLVDGKKMNLIQTDCAINPGNSGGGLFDRYGNLVGIVNAGYMGEIEGLNFAISTDTAFKQADSIIKNGYIEGRGNVNVLEAELLDGYADIAVCEYNRYNKDFVIITAINEYFYGFGLRVNDIIVSVTYKGEAYDLPTAEVYDEYLGVTLYPAEHFIDYLTYLDCKVGDELVFTVVHNGEGVTTDVTVILKQFIL